MGMAFGSKVDQIGLSKPPSGTARAEKLMSPNAVEQPDTQKTQNPGDNLKQFIGKGGKPSAPFGQQGRI